MISGWSKLKAPNAARAMLFSSGESFFHQMRLGNQLTMVAYADTRLREEIKKLKADVQASERK